jgi:multidrug resistance efflux pump
VVSWKRLLKSTLVGTTILGSLGFYATNRLRLTASYAVVAAPAISIHAPGDGTLSHSVRSFSVFSGDSQLASIKPMVVFDPELRAAKAELETVRAEIASLGELMTLGEEMRARTASRQSVLGRHRVEHLERVLERTSADVSAKQAELAGAELARQRSKELCAQGLMVTQECEALQTKAEVTQREAAAAEGQLGIARFLLESTRSGADVGQDMGSEVTYARQQRDDLTLRLATLKQQVQTREAHARALETRVNPPAIEVKVGSRSRTWTVLRQNGALVVKGEPLFEMVSCDQLFVFAAVSEDRYEQLRIGMTAKVRAGDKVYAGKIAQLLGPYGTFAQERGMQPQPPVILNGSDASNAAVAVEVDELKAAFGPNCEVGTHVEVEFSK